MAATRLTREMRERIHAALMKRAYVEKEATLKEMENELALGVYNELYSSEERVCLASAPEKFFAKKTCMVAEFNGCYEHVHLAEPMPFADKDTGYGCRFTFDGNHELTAKYEVWDKLRQEHIEDKRKLEAETVTVLASCSTAKQLCGIWPEVCPLLHELGISLEQEKCLLPAVRKDMNLLFKLPPEAFTEEYHPVDGVYGPRHTYLATAGECQ